MYADCLTYYIMIAFGIALEAFVLNKIIGYELKVYKIATVVISAVIIATPVLALVFYSNAMESILSLLPMLSFAIFPCCIFKTRKKSLFAFLGILLDFAMTFLASVCTSGISNTLLQWQYNIIYSGFLAVILCLCLLFNRKYNFELSISFFESIPMFFYIVLIIAIFSLRIFNGSEEAMGFDEILTDIATLVTLIGVCYLTVKYTSSASKERESAKLLDLQSKHYEELAQKNQDVRRFRHDIKNNMFALSILINDNKLFEAQQYISNLTETIKETENKISTGNYLADALIAQKADEANSENISIVFDGAVPTEINNNDICTIFGNSLDNAIRACIEIAPCTITVTSSINESGCTITVSNPVKQKVEIVNNTIKTTKTDRENHGLGLGNIKRAAEKYNGYMKLNCTDTEFSIKIGLLFSNK